MSVNARKMKSSHLVLLIMVAAVSAKQDPVPKKQSNLNSLDDDFRHLKSERISRAVSEVALGSQDADRNVGVSNANGADASPPNDLAVLSEDLRTFYGTRPQKFEQFMDLLAIKAQVKRKNASCTFRDICTHWSNHLFATNHSDHIKKLLQSFASNKDTFSGAVANGWLRNNCTEKYNNCDTFVRVVTSLAQNGDPAGDVTTTEPPSLEEPSGNSSTTTTNAY